MDPRGYVHVHNHSTHAFLHMHVTCSLPNSHTLTGDEVSEYYDPMIAKLVVWGQDRTTALKQLTESLQRYQVDTHTYTWLYPALDHTMCTALEPCISCTLQVAGVGTNIEFLGRLASHKMFAEGDVHTGFIEVSEWPT